MSAASYLSLGYDQERKLRVYCNFETLMKGPDFTEDLLGALTAGQPWKVSTKKPTEREVDYLQSIPPEVTLEDIINPDPLRPESVAEIKKSSRTLTQTCGRWLEDTGMKEKKSKKGKASTESGSGESLTNDRPNTQSVLRANLAGLLVSLQQRYIVSIFRELAPDSAVSASRSQQYLCISNTIEQMLQISKFNENALAGWCDENPGYAAVKARILETRPVLESLLEEVRSAHALKQQAANVAEMATTADEELREATKLPSGTVEESAK